MANGKKINQDLLSLFIRKYYNELCDENTPIERIKEWQKFFLRINYGELCGVDYDGKTLLDVIHRMVDRNDYKPVRDVFTY